MITLKIVLPCGCEMLYRQYNAQEKYIWAGGNHPPNPNKEHTYCQVDSIFENIAIEIDK